MCSQCWVYRVLSGPHLSCLFEALLKVLLFPWEGKVAHNITGVSMYCCHHACWQQAFVLGCLDSQIIVKIISQLLRASLMRVTGNILILLRQVLCWLTHSMCVSSCLSVFCCNKASLLSCLLLVVGGMSVFPCFQLNPAWRWANDVNFKYGKWFAALLFCGTLFDFSCQKTLQFLLPYLTSLKLSLTSCLDS